jgi:hypothetical protein
MSLDDLASLDSLSLQVEPRRSGYTSSIVGPVAPCYLNRALDITLLSVNKR